jgi:hypothetical protein
VYETESIKCARECETGRERYATEWETERGRYARERETERDVQECVKPEIQIHVGIA